MSNTFIFLALMIVGTFLLGFNDVQNKKALKKGIDEGVLVGIPYLGGGIALLIVVMFFGLPELREGFWLALVGTVFFNLVLQFAFMRAFSLSDASLIAPVRLLIPPLVILSGYLFLAETPSTSGVFGIFVTLFGFLLLLSPKLRFADSALANAQNRKGILFGLFGCFLSAFAFPLDKLAVVNSSGAFATAATAIGVGVLTICVHLILRPKKFITETSKALRHEAPILFSIGLFRIVGIGLTTQALAYSFVAYASSVKRLQALWTVLLSGAFLKEKGIMRRMFAVAVMFFGIILSVLAG